MIFHSLDFIAFFMVTVSLYWALPLRGQNVLLLGASYLFYGWVHPWFLWLIGATTVMWLRSRRALSTCALAAR